MLVSIMGVGRGNPVGRAGKGLVVKPLDGVGKVRGVGVGVERGMSMSRVERAIEGVFTAMPTPTLTETISGMGVGISRMMGSRETFATGTSISIRLGVGMVAFNDVLTSPGGDAAVGSTTSTTLETTPTSMIGNAPGSKKPVPLGRGSSAGISTPTIETSGCGTTGVGITSIVTCFVDRLLIVFVVVSLTSSGSKAATVGRKGFVNIRGRVGFTNIGLISLVLLKNGLGSGRGLIVGRKEFVNMSGVVGITMDAFVPFVWFAKNV